jgi:hypothetical protein
MCETCGGSLDGRRRHARFCGAPCRAAASRERGALRVGPGDGLDRFLAGLHRHRRNRTKAHRRGDGAASVALPELEAAGSA